MRYENQLFKDKTITLDDNEFINCKFENVEFIYWGGAFTLEPLSAKDSSFKFEGAAKNGADFQRRLITIAAQDTNEGALLNIGDVWFKRVPKPDHVD